MKTMVRTASRIVNAISSASSDGWPFDQLDHAVNEGLTSFGRDAHYDAVRQHLGAAGHRRTVTARFSNHGADSPVMADSSTDAMPSMISPSDGITSLTSHTTRSPFASNAAATSSSVPSGRSDEPRSPNASCAKCRLELSLVPQPWLRQNWRKGRSRRARP